eukprot:CAMPEP_0204823052 /NCGR_PEP_ID=MMETSP1346-20131115/1207_1 /ASSEMBLY_ACC=CAM_ASM_000771 /TAXON_ID=215587 /ORGANISM="Aplanochytrium stocchinoi, Strain GSBS06" /LENGTH=392 /DNA_ID=CAMNT_0051949585 /DNA_START=104 /DNA_END=1279 /DNA_ORIENTATION=+
MRDSNTESSNSSSTAKEYGSTFGKDFEILSTTDLKNLFSRAKILYFEIENTDKMGNDPDLQSGIRACIADLEKCSKGIRTLSIFSRNEHASDMITSNLQYMLPDFYLGRLYLKLIGKDVILDRLKALRLAIVSLESFLEKCNDAGLVSGDDKKTIDILNNQNQPGVGAKNDTGAVSANVDSRQLKIERFKRTRECEKQIEHIKQKLKNKGNNDSENFDDDEDLYRDMMFLSISNNIRTALDDINTANSEVSLLELQKKFQLQRMQEGSGDDLGDRKERPKETEKRGIEVTRIDANFQVKREVLKAGVFKPSWRQPTMSLEEYAKIEVADALEREKREAMKTKEEEMEKIKSHNVIEQGLEDDIEIVDKATMNDRAWDDWKDDNPKGSGRTKW